MERVTRAVVSGACGRSAADLYGNLYHLTELKVCPSALQALQSSHVIFFLSPLY